MKIFYSGLSLLLLALLLLTGKYSYLYYAGVMIGSILFLNRQKTFKQLPNFGWVNAVFFGYLTFIVVNRTRSIKFSDFTEGGINIAEHGFFALVVCLKLFVYLHLFTAFSLQKKAIFAAFIFNTIGVLNEIFQNWLNHRPLFIFIEDARKDLLVNLLGSFLFLFIFQFIKNYAKYTVKIR